MKEKALSVIVYSGYTFEELISLSKERKGYTDLLTFTDVLIDGRFEIDKKSMDLRFRGSRNQRGLLFNLTGTAKQLCNLCIFVFAVLLS